MNIDWQDSNDGSKHETIEFVAGEEGKRNCTGALWLPTGEASGALIACGHGASGDRYQAPIPYLAGKFSREGHMVVSIDGPVHGLRQVGPGGREAFANELRRPEMIDDMNSDWDLAIELAKSKAPVSLDRMAYFGLSMGSIFGIPMLAANSGGISLRCATLGLLGSQGLGDRIGSRLLKDANNLTVPLLVLMQLEDELFSREGYLALFDALGSNDKRIHAHPGPHADVPGEEMRASFEFMNAILAK